MLFQMTNEKMQKFQSYNQSPTYFSMIAANGTFLVLGTYYLLISQGHMYILNHSGEFHHHVLVLVFIGFGYVYLIRNRDNYQYGHSCSHYLNSEHQSFIYSTKLTSTQVDEEYMCSIAIIQQSAYSPPDRVITRYCALYVYVPLQTCSSGSAWYHHCDRIRQVSIYWISAIAVDDNRIKKYSILLKY